MAWHRSSVSSLSPDTCSSRCRSGRPSSRGSAASWLLSLRRQALTLLEYCTAFCVLPNVRAKLAPTVGRQGLVGENVPRTADQALVARRWGST